VFYWTSFGQRPLVLEAKDPNESAAWNSLPIHLQTTTNTNTFKRLLKTYLFTTTYYLFNCFYRLRINDYVMSAGLLCKGTYNFIVCMYVYNVCIYVHGLNTLFKIYRFIIFHHHDHTEAIKLLLLLLLLYRIEGLSAYWNNDYCKLAWL